MISPGENCFFQMRRYTSGVNHPTQLELLPTMCPRATMPPIPAPNAAPAPVPIIGTTEPRTPPNAKFLPARSLISSRERVNEKRFRDQIHRFCRPYTKDHHSSTLPGESR